MKIKLIIVICMFSTLTIADSYTNKISFFGTNEYKIQHQDIASEFNYEINSYNLDDLKNFENMISANLPKDHHKAQEIVNKRLDKNDESKTMEMFQGTALLISWDIKKLPAFVFGEGDYVVYGVTDTSIAINRFSNSRKR